MFFFVKQIIDFHKMCKIFEMARMLWLDISDKSLKHQSLEGKQKKKVNSFLLGLVKKMMMMMMKRRRKRRRKDWVD